MLPKTRIFLLFWSPTLREKLRLMVCEERLLRKISGAQDTEGQGLLHSDQLNNLYESPNIIRMIKSRK